MTAEKDDYGKSEFSEIGKLSSMLPAYIRHCCRSLHDGTDTNVLDAYRTVAYKTLLKYEKKYTFIHKHLDTLKIFSPDDIREMIQKTHCDNAKTQFYCLATSTALGLPKRACLHCPKVSVWMKRLNEAGTVDNHGNRKQL